MHPGQLTRTDWTRYSHFHTCWFSWVNLGWSTWSKPEQKASLDVWTQACGWEVVAPNHSLCYKWNGGREWVKALECMYKNVIFHYIADNKHRKPSLFSEAIVIICHTLFCAVLPVSASPATLWVRSLTAEVERWDQESILIWNYFLI